MWWLYFPCVLENMIPLAYDSTFSRFAHELEAITKDWPWTDRKKNNNRQELAYDEYIDNKLSAPNIYGGHVYLTVVSSLKSRLYDRTVTSKRDIKLV